MRIIADNHTWKGDYILEQWKVIPDTEGKLFISDTGRIMSHLRDEKILKTQIDSKGYKRLRVTINRQKKAYKVHRLVANAFIDNPENKPQVNHINGDKSDNRVCNLEWCTNIENCHHAIKNGLWDSVFASSKRENDARKKCIVAKNIDTGEEMIFRSIRDAELSIGSRHIVDVLKGRRLQAKGYSFEYMQGGDANVAEAK